MPPTVLNSVAVELELTPSYWSDLAQALGASATPEAVILHARCVAAALNIKRALRVVTDRTRFFVVVNPSKDDTLAHLCEQAAAVREGLETFERSFLPARAKYLPGR